MREVDPHERRLYHARLKAERDAISNVDSAFNEGREKERIESEKRMVRMLQEILRLPISPDSDLASDTLEDLQRLSPIFAKEFSVGR